MDLLIFDFDGLILDTETTSFQAWSEIFESYGTSLPLNQWARCIGTAHNTFNVYEFLEKQTGQKLNHAELSVRYGKRQKELLGPLKPRPGVVEYLEAAQEQKIALALASSSDQGWVVGHLSRLGIADMFHSIRCSDDVENVKPHPELYHLTLTFMGVRPENALAFEDSPNGIKAAKAAGIYTVAVPNSVTRELPIDQADMRLDSMADLSLRDLLHQIETRKR